MSTIMSVQSTAAQSVHPKEKSDIFQDLPLVDRSARLTVMELKRSDKQIINELIYRWCRIVTRLSKKSLDRLAGPSDTAAQDSRKVLIIDMIGSINLVRLATVMKRDERRMRMIGIARGCKINSTYVTLSSYLGRQANLSSSLKLVIVYQDEFFILRTLESLKDFLQTMICQVVLVVPRLDRQEYDVLNLTSNFQLLRCDFCVNRREIGPAPPETTNDSYQTYLNQIYFQRYPSNKHLPDKVYGELREDLLYLDGAKPPTKLNESITDCSDRSVKRIKSDNVHNKQQ